MGPDLNKSFSESLRSNRSVSKRQNSAKENKEKESAFEMNLEDGSNPVKHHMKSSASISPRSGHVSSDVETMDELLCEVNSNRMFDVRSNELKGAKTSTTEDEQINTPKEPRLLPPLIGLE